MAHSPNTKGDNIYKKQIFERYSHLGKRNFLTYAFKAAEEYYHDGDGVAKPGLNSPAIRKQLRNHFPILLCELARKNDKWFLHKLKAKKAVTPQYI